MAYELRTEISIDAPAERVWSILTDFASYPAWNPFVVRIEGRLQLAERLEIELRPPGRKSMTFKPHVTCPLPLPRRSSFAPLPADSAA